MIQDLRDTIIQKWNDTSVKTKLICAAVIIVVVLLSVL
jgi:hypothetical protein